jgi:hypothetical protein
MKSRPGNISPSTCPSPVPAGQGTLKQQAHRQNLRNSGKAACKQTGCKDAWAPVGSFSSCLDRMRISILSSRSSTTQICPRRTTHGEGKHADVRLDASAGTSLRHGIGTERSLTCFLQFDYYNIPFCEPKNGERALPENLGEVLAGERTETSAYQFHTNVSRLCKTACRKHWTAQNVDEYRDFAALVCPCPQFPCVFYPNLHSLLRFSPMMSTVRTSGPICVWTTCQERSLWFIATKLERNSFPTGAHARSPKCICVSAVGRAAVLCMHSLRPSSAVAMWRHIHAAVSL